MVSKQIQKLAEKLHLINDTPHRTALGLALGLFVGWTPTVGIQTFLVLPLAWMARGNLVSSMIGIYLSNPLTMIFMYWLEFKVGALLMRDPPSIDEFRTAIEALGWSNWSGWMDRVGWRAFAAMWLGGCILGLLTAIPAYFATRWIVHRYRQRRQRVPPARPMAPAPSIAQDPFSGLEES